MAASDFIGMRQQRERLQQQVERLTNRCYDLEDEVDTQIQARRASDSRVFELEQACRAREADVEALRSQLHQERLRADAMSKGVKPVHNPASIPLRIVAVGDSRTDLAVAGGLSLNDSVSPSNPSEPSPGPVPPLSQYPCEIPEEDREAIRTRMLKDRGPYTQAPAASPQGVEETPRAPSRGAHVSGPSLDDGEMPSFQSTSRVFAHTIYRTNVFTSPVLTYE